MRDGCEGGEALVVCVANEQIMIRPRPGSFVYSDNELDVMLADILAAKDEGAYGVVFGCLTQDGEVDTAACERLVQAARPLEGASIHPSSGIGALADRQ